MIERLDVKRERRPIVLIPEVTYSQAFVNMHCVNVPLRLSLIIPVMPKRAPVILWLEGGGWKTLNEMYAVPELVYLAEAGYAVACVQYRTSAQAAFPGQIDDAKSAVRFLRGNADRFFLDAERVGAMGRSAGGTIASMMSMDDEAGVSAVVSMYAIYDFNSYYAASDYLKTGKAEAISNIEAYLGTFGRSDDEVLRKASPIRMVSEGARPHMLIQGTKDAFVPEAQSADFHDALAENGVPVELIVIDGASHGSEEFDQICIKDRIVRFFNEHVQGGR